MRSNRYGAIIALTLAFATHAAPTGPAVNPINDPDGLVAAYIEMGLPMPPPDAVMVQLQISSAGVNFGFVLEKGDQNQPPLLLIGTEAFRCPWPVKVIDTKRLDAGRVRAEWSEQAFEINSALATAIQCRARGEDAAATSLLDASLRQEVGHHSSRFRQRANLAPRTALAIMAWSHWMGELVQAGADRAAALKRLKALIAAEAALNDAAHQELILALEATLVPSAAKPASVESMIDSLVDHPYEAPRPKGETDRAEPNPRVLEVALRAFEAIPALLEHLDDKRLTRGLKGGQDNAPLQNQRVGDVVRELIEALAGNEMERDYLYRFHMPGEKKDAAMPWWTRAKGMNQEEYFVSHVLPAEGTKRGFPHLLLLRVIREKHPDRLPELFLTVLEKRRDVAIHYVIKEVMRSALPRERKLELLTRAADSDDLEHRRAAYWALKELDPAAFADRLVKTIEALPQTPEEPYWKCREGTFATLATQTDDPRVWKALAAAAKRADVWLRMQYLNAMTYECKERLNRRRRLEFLVQFFEDAEVRQAQHWRGMPDTKSKYFGPFAGATFDRIEVRDFAGMQAAYLLELSDTPSSSSNWTPDQWAAFRDRIKVAVQKESSTP